jgi:hypothetical protein
MMPTMTEPERTKGCEPQPTIALVDNLTLSMSYVRGTGLCFSAALRLGASGR